MARKGLSSVLFDLNNMFPLIQAMNTSLSGLRSDQELDAEEEPPPPSDTASLWEAITRLDNMVVNNNVKVRPITSFLAVNS